MRNLKSNLDIRKYLNYCIQRFLQVKIPYVPLFAWQQLQTLVPMIRPFLWSGKLERKLLNDSMKLLRHLYQPKPLWMTAQLWYTCQLYHFADIFYHRSGWHFSTAFFLKVVKLTPVNLNYKCVILPYFLDTQRGLNLSLVFSGLRFQKFIYIPIQKFSTDTQM